MATSRTGEFSASAFEENLLSIDTLAEWGEVFGDTVVATALLDRLLHHAIVVRIEGASYRLRRHADLLPDTSSARPIASPEPPRRRGRPPKLRTADLSAAT
ncbi:hypothetical protein EAH89_29740 [Roseomonas nepalensis]|uniref:IstB-like ATP-binding domain-containing protein n=1 Tax=Muricoccus nepalensis TaxID=1854500 RepID=A0A502EJL5_9PROT|nr:hypothetical protein EAH89_29740 [Roseomonas nepalensis]